MIFRVEGLGLSCCQHEGDQATTKGRQGPLCYFGIVPDVFPNTEPMSANSMMNFGCRPYSNL